MLFWKLAIRSRSLPQGCLQHQRCNTTQHTISDVTQYSDLLDLDDETGNQKCLWKPKILTGMRPSLKCAKLFLSSVSKTLCGITMNLERLLGKDAHYSLWSIFKSLTVGFARKCHFSRCFEKKHKLNPCCCAYFTSLRLLIYLVDISKRSLTELTLHPVAPHLSSSCSQSVADSNQFMWASRRRLLRNCFISGEETWFIHIKPQCANAFWCIRFWSHW